MINLALVRHLELAIQSRGGSGQPITFSAALVTLCRFILLANVLHGDGMNYQVLDRGPVEGDQEVGLQPVPSQDPQEMEALLGFFDQGGCVNHPRKVLRYVGPEEFEGGQPLYKFTFMQIAGGSALSLRMCMITSCFPGVEGEVVSVTFCQSVSSSFVIRPTRVASSANLMMKLQGCMEEQSCIDGVQKQAQDTALW